MSNVTIVELAPQQTAVVRGRIPLAGLAEFFGSAFTAVATAAAAQGIALTGPPFGCYEGAPTDVVQVSAGFPVASPIEPEGDVVPLVLPGGRAAQTVHVGPYDTLGETYGELTAWMSEHQLTPAGDMWESYLSDPDEVPAAQWETLIVWPVGA